MAHFYSMSYQQVRDMPLKTFWLMSGNIERLTATEDMRELDVAVHSQSGDAAVDLHKKLVVKVGEIVKVQFDPIANAERDDDGFNTLREMAKQ